ncbi:hypothetical protein BU23DRAFT_568536 [Bimuria novae-zelandiae CBS 107.79]|uniref:Uncharacterized protein n=1 Tax=Bimuria novae-zelandiae CBS 107.79 TaxID=1447943 RepID=A0A6A5V9A5_9PLEO|nr:hypothetical protein BU23DRAFT_568536 [Bimuria novae-zelandiae CBS 107.79]
MCGQAAEHRARAVKITALIWTCKAIASEALKIFCGIANIALDVNDCPGCLRYISSIGRLQVRRITLCGKISATGSPPFESGFIVSSKAETFDSAPLLAFFPNVANITIQICSHFADCRAWNLWQEAANDIKVQQVEIMKYTNCRGLNTVIIRRWQRMRWAQEFWVQDSTRCVLHRTSRTLPKLLEDSEDSTDEEHWYLE